QDCYTKASIRSAPLRRAGQHVRDESSLLLPPKGQIAYLAFLNQVLHCSRYIFDWHVGVHAVLIEQVDAIDLESLERGFGDFLDVLWPTIQTSQTSLRLGINFPPKLGGYHHLPTERGEGFAHEFLVCVWTIRSEEHTS